MGLVRQLTRQLTFAKSSKVAPALQDLITRAVAKVKKNKDGKLETWVPGGMPIDEVDEIYGIHLLALKEGRMKAVTDTSGPKKAVEVVQEELDSFFTAVLATVHAGAWRLNWVAGILFVLLCSVPRCGVLTLLAIKGGDACDCEIKFIEALMEELGAEVNTFREVLDDGKYIMWIWDLERKGAGRCMVNLYQYQKVEHADVGMLRKDFLPMKDLTHAPDLRRVAVVSAPVVDKEEKPIAQKLNENVSQALEGAKALADKKGFMPVKPDFAHLGEGQMDAYIKAYGEYISG